MAERNRFWDTVLSPSPEEVSLPIASQAGEHKEFEPVIVASSLLNDSETSFVTISPHQLSDGVFTKTPATLSAALDTAKTLSNLRFAMPAGLPASHAAEMTIAKPYACGETSCTARFSHVSSKYRHYRTVVWPKRYGSGFERNGLLLICFLTQLILIHVFVHDLNSTAPRPPGPSLLVRTFVW
jgi:hypothetical protein